MQLSYWSKHTYTEATHLKAILPEGHTAQGDWSHPLPPDGCEFALLLQPLDFFLFGNIKDHNIEAYQKALPTGSRVIAENPNSTASLSLRLNQMLSRAPEWQPVDLLAHQTAASDGGHFQALYPNLTGEPGTFTIDPQQLLSPGKSLFPDPAKSFINFLNHYLGAANSHTIRPTRKRSVLSTLHSASFDGTPPNLKDFDQSRIVELYLTGDLEDPDTWAAALCLAFREMREVVQLSWQTPTITWTVRYDKQRNLHIKHSKPKTATSGQSISIRLVHGPLENIHFLWSAMRDFPDLIDYPAKMLKPIVALKGTNHFSDKEKLEFDGEIDQPYSLIVGDLGTGRMSFYLNRCPCILPSPLPCTIQVLGASLKSDLSRSIVVPMELQHQIQTLAAPYVHQALLDCCRQGGHRDPNLDALILSRPTKNTIQNDPATTITTQFRHFLGKNPYFHKQPPYARDQASIEILKAHIAISTWSGQSKTISDWETNWDGRLILASSNQNSVPDGLETDVINSTPGWALPLLRFLFPNRIFTM